MTDIESTESSVSDALVMLLRSCTRIVARIWRVVFPRKPEPPRRIHQVCLEVEVPSLGDAFNFPLSIRELWTRSGDADALGLAVAEHIKGQHMTVERQLRAISRRFAPDAVEAFERAANAELGGPTLFPDDPDLDCNYVVQAAPDEELRKYSRDAEIKRLNLERLSSMRDAWLEFLKALDDNPLGPLAAELADDQKLSDAMAKRASERKQLTHDLHDLYDRASEAYRDKDVFEFVTTTDSALGRLLSHLRIDGTDRPDGGLPDGQQR